MKTRWLITPYFFEKPDGALTSVLPKGAAYQINTPPDVSDRSVASLARLHGPIASFVQVAAGAGDLAVSVAGDCGASLPVMAGLQAAGLDPVLVWLDAHGDFNTIETSPSGFLGGMPLAMMVGCGDLSLPQACGQAPVNENDVWLVDARDLDPLERDALHASKVNRIDISQLSRLRLERPVYLHIDNDIVDAAQVPANNYPVSGGPSLDQVTQACVQFVKENQICAISLSGWNGTLDTDGKTAAACTALINAVADAVLART